MLDKLLTRTNTLEKALDATWLRNEVISENIANADTPGYKSRTVKFEEYLSSALEGKDIKGFTSNERHMSIGRKSMDKVEINVAKDNAMLSTRLDGNNVDIENEMASLAKNSIQYSTLTQKLNGDLKKIKTAINEGRK